MLSAVDSIKKIKYEKQNKLLHIYLDVKRYIPYSQIDTLIEDIRQSLYLDKTFDNIRLHINNISIDKTDLSSNFDDVLAQLFTEYPFINLYKELVKYEYDELKNTIKVYLPDEIEKFEDVNIVNSFFNNAKNKLASSLSIDIFYVQNQEAAKIRDNYFKIISQIKPAEPTRQVEPEKQETLHEDIKPVLIQELDTSVYQVIVEAVVTYVKWTHKEQYISLEFGIKDYSGEIVCRKFFNPKQKNIEKFEKLVKENIALRINGKHLKEKYSPEYYINIDSISEMRLSSRQDTAKLKRVELNVDSSRINNELLLELIHKWKHDSVGVMPSGGITSFLKIHKVAKENFKDIKIMYGVTLNILMDDVSCIYNPNSLLVSNHLCCAYIENEKIVIFNLSEIMDLQAIKHSTTFDKNDHIGIRDFCGNSPLYFFGQSDYDDFAYTISKSGITVIEVKKLFEFLENKTYTLDSLYMRLKSDSSNVVTAALNAHAIIKKNFVKYADISDRIAHHSFNNKSQRIYPVSILIQNDKGRQNLYRILTKKNILWNAIPRSYLNAFRYGLYIGSSDTDGQMYTMLLENVETDDIYQKALFYDFINILTDAHGYVLYEKEKIKQMTEFRNFNKFLVKCAHELGIKAVASCYPTDLEKKSFMNTNEMLSEFKYLGNEMRKNIVVNYPNEISSKIMDISPILVNKAVDDIEARRLLQKKDDGSSSYNNHLKDIEKRGWDRLILNITDFINQLTTKNIMNRIQSVYAADFIAKLLNQQSVSYTINHRNLLVIHVESNKVSFVINLIKQIFNKYRPFIVEQLGYTVIYFLKKGQNIYDFSPMKYHAEALVPEYDEYALSELLPSIKILPSKDLNMISNLEKVTGTIAPLAEDIPSYDELMQCTADKKTKDVLDMVKPNSMIELIRCMGLIHGQGTWYNNAERLIRERLLELSNVICFLHEYESIKEDSHLLNDSKRLIQYCIEYDEARIHAEHLLFLSWYKHNYVKEFSLEYLNRYDIFSNLYVFKNVLKPDISLSNATTYIQLDNYASIVEPLNKIEYLDERQILDIIKNRPYISIQDFEVKNKISEEISLKLKNDGYLSNIKQSSQLNLNDYFDNFPE